MLKGKVNDRYEAIVEVTIRDVDHRTHDIKTVLDTGFTGFLTLPVSLIEVLQLNGCGRSSAMLADGSCEYFDLYFGEVIWNGRPKLVFVHAIETHPLLGMSLLRGHEIALRVVIGGEVQITKI